MDLKNLLYTLGFMFILIISGSLIGKFFDIGEIYYIPFIFWGISLCIFNLILNKYQKNKYMIELGK